jgi:hypothetical protein
MSTQVTFSRYPPGSKVVGVPVAASRNIQQLYKLVASVGSLHIIISSLYHCMGISCDQVLAWMSSMH